MAHIHKLYIVLLYLSATTSLIAQRIDNAASFRDIKSDNYFRFLYDNDFFTATDYYYTQGYTIELVSPMLRYNPINKILPGLPDSETRYGLAFEQTGYTPTDITDDKIRYNDRPFAATIALENFKIVNDTINKSRLISSVTIGMIGPAALGNEIQTGIHKWIDDDIPRGWQYQIKNDIILDYQVSYEKQLIRINNYFAVSGHTNVRLGTLNTKASAGFTVTAGLCNSPFTSYKNKNNFQVYVYSQPFASVTGYDATLHGGVFNSKSAYIIHLRDIERLTLSHNSGIVIQYKSLFFEYSHSLLTREFKSGQPHAWGGFKIGFKL